MEKILKEEVLTELCKKEHAFLRQELGHLKDCQIKFLTFSVMTTGLILGFISRSKTAPLSENPNLLPGTLWLLPLVVLLPSWWIFFDKATTITRIVGYFRVIEKIILGQKVALKFLGWESALAEFRRRHAKRKENTISGKTVPLDKCILKQFIVIGSSHIVHFYVYHGFVALSA